MAYRHGQRRQGVLFPASIEDYVSGDSPVRAYDAIIDTLKLESLGFEVDSIAAMMILDSIADFKPEIQTENITITEKTVYIRQIIKLRKKPAQPQTSQAA